MDKLNKEYIALLSGEGNASDKFWKLEKRIREDKKDCGVQCTMSRSNQFYIMMSLLNEGAITLDLRSDSGENSRKEHNAVLQKMKQVKADKSMILVATGKLIGEGFDYPRLDTLIMAMPVKNCNVEAGQLWIW